MTWRQYAQNRAIFSAALRSATENLTNEITSSIELYQYGLRGARGSVLTAGHDRITRKIFRRYSQTRDVAGEFPGARGFGFIRRVPQADEKAFLDNARRDDFPDFAIRQLTPHDGDRYVIQYIEPVERNLAAVGLDTASEEHRRVAADRAARTGETTLTGPITLVQGTEIGQQSFLILLPVYDTSGTPATPEERAQRVVGWSYAPLSMKDVFAHITVDSAELVLRLEDITDPDKIEPFFQTEFNPSQTAVATSTAERAVFGRTWRVTVTATPAFVAGLALFPSSTVLVMGTLASLLVTAVVALGNISQQRERAIQAEQARLATIVENSSDPIISQSLDGLVTSWNRAAERLFGYREEEVLGRPLALLVLPADRRSEDASLLERVSREEIIAPFDTVRVDRNGTPIDMSVTVGPIRDTNGKIIGAAKLLRDIRRQKEESRRLSDFNQQLERQVSERTTDLKRTNTLLRDVLRAASEVSIIATEVDGTIRIFNEGAQRMLGYRAEEVVGKHTPALIHLSEEIAARGAELTAEYGVPIEGFRVFVHVPELLGSERHDWTYVRKDGTHLYVSLAATPMRDENGKIIGYLGIAEDITEQRQAIEALHVAKLAADAANDAKSRFLAMMSHELRTPMTGVLGMADLLMTSGLQAEQRDMMRTLTRSAKSLLDLLNDILDFAKIEAGKVELEHIDFSVRQIVEDIVAIFAPLASERGNTVDHTIADEIGKAYQGDAKRYRQVLMNLIGNANKFTANGRINIKIAQRVLENNEIELVSSVSDTGVGIMPENLERLFQPFVQEEASTSRKFGGTGLGLSICKNLAELMGGRIWVESARGTGSTFTFTVRLRPGNVANIDVGIDAQKRVTSSEDLPLASRRLRILVAEDNETNRMLMTAMLSRLGHAVVAVENGALAVSQIDQEPSDIILMDMQMPVMDGMAATSLIRGRSDSRARIPVIALTADAVRDNHRAYFGAGVDAIVTKPVDWHRLHAEMERLTSGRQPEANTGEGTDPQKAPDDEGQILDPLVIEELIAAIGLETFIPMISTFERNAEDFVRILMSDEPDATTLKRTAHGLKGLASQFGATQLSALARKIEIEADRGPVADLVQMLPATVHGSVAALRHLTENKSRIPA